MGLQFPFGRAPRVNQSHIAAGSILRFSGVPMVGGGYINLLNGRFGTRSATSLKIDTFGLGVTANGSNTGLIFPGTTALDTTATMAAISRISSGGNVGLISNGTDATTGGFALYAGNGPNWIVETNLASPTFKSGGGTRVAGDPYFSAVSFNASVTNFVALNLRTGQLITTTTASAITNSSGSNGSVYIGNGLGGSVHLANGTLAPTMWSNAFLSTAQLAQWANNPFDFWYPDAFEDGVGMAAILARYSQMSMMGVG